MKKLSRNQAIGVAAALVVIAFLLYGNFFLGLFNQSVSTATTTTEATMPTQNGLQVVDEVVGQGATAEPGDTVSVNYTGTLADGTVFDSTSLHGNTPFSFTLGVGQVIPGWDQGLLGMQVGGKRKLTISPSLAYGGQDITDPSGKVIIPANSTLTFDVTLLNVAKGSATAAQ